MSPDSHFAGYSVASSDGFETSRRPPDPKEWEFAEKFYRADLSGFTPFHQPVLLKDLFSSRRAQLEVYFDQNKSRGTNRLNIFYVRQAGKLQCLNGAYLSDVDDELLSALFGPGETVDSPLEGRVIVSVETDSQISMVWSCLGQAKFSPPQ